MTRDTTTFIDIDLGAKASYTSELRLQQDWNTYVRAALESWF